MTEEQLTEIRLPIEWHLSAAKVPSRYANNMIVQHTDTEFIISFFEIFPPVVLGSPKEQTDQLNAIGVVQPECVARVVVSPEKFESFINALQQNLDRFRSRSDQEE